MIPYGRQSISSDDIKSVVEVLRSDFFDSKVRVSRFSRKRLRTIAELSSASR